MTIKEFFEVEDVKLRKYLYVSGRVYSDQTVKIVDNEEKIAFYLLQTSLRMNKQGAFYINNALVQYIVYRKKEKKVVLSASKDLIFFKLLEYYFYSVNVITTLNIRPTPTLCKKIIEGSINTIGDFMRYIRSYVVKKKDLDIVTINKFSGRWSLLDVVEDPENVESLDQVLCGLDSDIIAGKIFTFKIGDINKQNDKIAEWRSEQANKALKLRSGRSDQDGYYFREDVDGPTSVLPYKSAEIKSLF